MKKDMHFFIHFRMAWPLQKLRWKKWITDPRNSRICVSTELITFASEKHTASLFHWDFNGQCPCCYWRCRTMWRKWKLRINNSNDDSDEDLKRWYDQYELHTAPPFC
jgi:hypothetical protein